MKQESVSASPAKVPLPVCISQDVPPARARIETRQPSAGLDA